VPPCGRPNGGADPRSAGARAGRGVSGPVGRRVDPNRNLHVGSPPTALPG
jgi:hypothetical protein